MRDNEQHIDDLFRDMLKNYKEQPRPEAWEGVKARMADSGNRKPKPFPLRWWWIIGGLLLITGLLLLGRGSLSTNQEMSKSEYAGTLPANTAGPVKLQDKGKNRINEDINTQRGEHNESDNVAKQPYSIGIAESEHPDVNTADKDADYATDRAVLTAPVQKTGPGKKKTSSMQPDNYPQHNKQQGATTGDKTRNPFLPGQESTQSILYAGKQDGYIPKQRNKEQPINFLKTRKKTLAAVPLTDIAREELVAVLLQGIALTHTAEDITLTTNTTEAEFATRGGKTSSTTEDVTAHEEQIPENRIAQSSDNNKPLGNTEKANSKTATDTNTSNSDKGPDLRNFKNGWFSNFSAGAKMGYQSSFNSSNDAARYLFAGFLQYNFSGRISVAMQPAYLAGNAKVTINGNGRSYYNITGSSLDSSVFTEMSNNIRDPDTIYRTYFYTESYDSVYVSTNLQDKKLWDIEIPVVFKYRLLNGVYLQAGGVGSYSKLINATETRSDYKGLQNTYTEELEPQLHELNQPVPEAPSPKSTKELFSYNGEPLGNYQPQQIGHVKSFFRWGYTAGIGIEIKKRLLLDATMIHMPAAHPSVIDMNIRQLYTRPYYRFTIGYKFKN